MLTIVAPWADAFAPCKPLDTEECLLNFAAISDMHYESEKFDEEDALYSDITNNIYLYDFSQAKEKLDALVIAGDITEHGYVSQWDRAEKILTSQDVADEIILAMGNHDLSGRRQNCKRPVYAV